MADHCSDRYTSPHTTAMYELSEQDDSPEMNKRNGITFVPFSPDIPRKIRYTQERTTAIV